MHQDGRDYMSLLQVSFFYSSHVCVSFQFHIYPLLRFRRDVISEESLWRVFATKVETFLRICDFCSQKFLNFYVYTLLDPGQNHFLQNIVLENCMFSELSAKGEGTRYEMFFSPKNCMSCRNE